jgi:Restriction endonuclease
MKAWARSFYLSTAWEKTRVAYLISQDYICERCGEPAKVVHHRVWITRKNINDINIILSWENLEALCQDCHNKEHHKKEISRRYNFDKDGNVIPPIAKSD